MSRGSDDRPLARPVPLRVASTEGLDRILVLCELLVHDVFIGFTGHRWEALRGHSGEFKAS
jgi:hypothetical protein